MFQTRYQPFFSLLLILAICGPMVNAISFSDEDYSYFELVNEEENNEQEAENSTCKNMFLLEPQKEVLGYFLKSTSVTIPFHRSTSVNFTLEVVLPPPKKIILLRC